MLIIDLFKETYLAISANKTRSGLTILGIVIGIGSVVAMISIGQGAKKTIESSIESLGSNLVMVMPGAGKTFSTVAAARGTAQTLTIKDANAIEREVQFVQAVTPLVSRNFQVVARGKNTRTQVIGTNASYSSVRNVLMEYGTFFSEKDVLNQVKVVVLGPIPRDDLFGEGINPVGQTIRIQGINFRVIGLTKSKGGLGLFSEDDIVFIPITTCQKFLTGNEFVSAIVIQAQSPQLIETVQNKTTEFLLRRRNIKNPQMIDFSVMNQQDIISVASSMTNTMTILLAAIAGISLIVGGIGIMNMMMTTVTERTREIGLRKAIGAKRSDIGLQFLAEAVVLTFFGGVIGILLGSGLAYGITFFTGMTTKISLFSIILAFSVSAIIGIGFGYWPAQKAAKLNPIEALRYE